MRFVAVHLEQAPRLRYHNVVVLEMLALRGTLEPLEMQGTLETQVKARLD
jgi:hypothetical protein